MRFPFLTSRLYPPASGGTEGGDGLSPLRELRSPFSTGAIRARVLARTATKSLPLQLKVVLAEALVVGVAGVSVLNIAGPVPGVRDLGTEFRVPVSGVRTTDLEPQTSVLGPRISGSIQRDSGLQTTVISSFVHRNARDERSSAGTYSNEHASGRLKAMDPGYYPVEVAFVQPVAIKSIAMPTPLHTAPYDLPQGELRSDGLEIEPSEATWFTSVCGGAVFSQTRMMGERAEIGIEQGWKTLAIAYATSEDSRDVKDELLHHPGLTAPLLSRAGNQEFSILFGACTKAGPLEFRAMAGPAYLFASSAYYNYATGTTGTPAVLRGIGGAAEAAVFYHLNTFVDGGLMGTANYVSHQFTAGLYGSLDIHFGS